MPAGQYLITFDLPIMQDGWPAVESFAHLPVLERNGLDAAARCCRVTVSWRAGWRKPTRSQA